MSYPPPYGGQYPDIYGAESPSTPHPHQPPGSFSQFPQWETLEHAQAQDLHSLHSSHHSTPMQTPTSTSFPVVELEEPPHLVPSQAHFSHTGSPLGDAPILLHHPHAAQPQYQQYQQQHPQYNYLSQQQQQLHQSDYEPMQQMGPPDSSTLFRAPQQSMGVHRSIPSSRGRAAESRPYYRRTSESVPHHGHDSRGGSVESPAAPVVVSPVPSTSGGDVTTPVTPVAPVLSPPPPPLPSPTRTTPRRTRSAAKPKASVRFESGTKTTSGPAPSTSRVPAARSGTPVPSTSTSTVTKSSTPVLRSSTRKSASSARTPPPSQTGATSTSAAASGSDSGTALRAVPPILQPTSSTSTSIPSSSIPKPSIVASSSVPQPSAAFQAPPFAPAQAHAPRFTRPAPVSNIRTDIQYSMRTHVMTASLELPGVKSEHLHVKLGTSFYNRSKTITILALNLPVFREDADGEEESGVLEAHGQALTSSSTVSTERMDVHIRREEEEEEEDGDSTMKTDAEVPQRTTSMPAPTMMNPGAQSTPATSTAPSPLNMPPLTSNPSTSASTSDPRLIASSLWDIYGPYKPPTSAPQNMTRLTGTDVGVIGRIADPNTRERRYGPMRRVLRVPPATKLEHISAKLEAGVLTVQVDCGEPIMFDDNVDIPVHVV